jgi:REP element-mobilizing transposase RayT
MTSPNPLLYDTYYHIYNRGNNRDNIFFQERNYYYFLELYNKFITPVADTFAYCLLRNHFHISVRIKSEAEIIETIKTLKVSIPDQGQGRRNQLASNATGQPEKPSGLMD